MTAYQVDDDPYACGGEFGPAPDHDIEWVDESVGRCRNCGAEFIEDDDD